MQLKGTRVVVMGFSDKSGYSGELSDYLKDSLEIQLGKRSVPKESGQVRFEVFNRDKLDEAFKELSIRYQEYLSGRFDEKSLQRIGRHIGANTMITGSYTLTGAGERLLLTCKVLDVESAKNQGGEIVEIPMTATMKGLLSRADDGPRQVQPVRRDQTPVQPVVLQPTPTPGPPRPDCSTLASRLQACKNLIKPKMLQCAAPIQAQQKDLGCPVGR